MLLVANFERAKYLATLAPGHDVSCAMRGYMRRGAKPRDRTDWQ
jgi:hypothetical protein